MTATAFQSDLSSATTAWAEYEAAACSPAYKRAIYLMARPFMHVVKRLSLNDPATAMPKVRWVLSERGFPVETRRKWVDSIASLAGKHVLVQGTGSGWDTLSWLPFSPAKVTAYDAFSFERAWTEVAAEARSRGYVPPVFGVASLEKLPLASKSVDVVCSDAVYEHCVNLDAVLNETRRVLVPGGHVYASFGPLWFCFGGDHFSGRGGDTFGFSHVELPEAEYRSYFRRFVQESEDAQSGGRYVEMDLFSRLTTRDYAEAFARAGFEVVESVIQLSTRALAFKRQWPERFAAMCEKHRLRASADDFLIFSNLVVLRRAR